MPEDYPVSIADQMMVLWLQRTVISLEMAKVEDLKPMIIGLRACALAATRNSIKGRISTNPKGYRCLRMRIALPLENFLKGAI